MKVFTAIAWTAIGLVLLAAYSVALTKLRLAEIHTDPWAVASGATMEFNQVMPHASRSPAQMQARWLARGLFPKTGRSSDPALIAGGEGLR